MINMIVSGIVATLAIVFIALIFCIKKKGDVEFAEYINAIDGEKFKTKNYLSIGLFLSEQNYILRFVPKVFYEPLYRYTESVNMRVKELYGVKYYDFYLKIHNGSKWLMGVVGVLVALAFAGINCINKEPVVALVCVLIAPAIGLGLALLQDKDLDGKIEERRTAIKIEFPEFINKLLLLVNAGMTISKAWEKIVTESNKTTPLYEELNASLAEIRAGKAEIIAYEEFARRCRVKEIIKFVSVIILNLKKGGSEVVPTLRNQSDECWEMRKATAKRLGEKASSKLMLPMGIMLVGIMLITVLPAILSLLSM